MYIPHIQTATIFFPYHTTHTLSSSKMPSLNFMIGEDPLSLDRIRSVLIRLEDTIIFSLIERAQFAHNPRMYQRGAFKELLDLGFQGSWLEWFLKEIETFHGM
jgi:chorismate mutase